MIGRYAKASGSPNGATNEWLSGCRNQKIRIEWPEAGGAATEGMLRAWDNYSLILEIDGEDKLFLKQPGMAIEKIKTEGEN